MSERESDLRLKRKFEKCDTKNRGILYEVNKIIKNLECMERSGWDNEKNKTTFQWAESQKILAEIRIQVHSI